MDTSNRIPIAKPQLGDEEKQAVLDVIDSGHLTQGRVVAELEAAFAHWCGVLYAVSVSSGTAALHVAFAAHGIGPGDEVITSPFTFVATANAALFVGARPVFADIEPETFCLDPERVEAAINPRTRAIVPVHLYGHPARMPELRDIAYRHRLLLIEDACQAHGAQIANQMVGGMGDSGVFSLYPTKHIAAGEGGLITTNDARIAECARLLRNQGAEERYWYKILGYNFRLSDLHAAVGLAQLRKVDRFIEDRRRNAAQLTERLCGLEQITTPMERSRYRHVYHQYVIRVRGGRSDLPRYLESRGIGTAVHYPMPLHQTPLYRELGYAQVHLPTAEMVATEVLSLPIHSGVRPADIDYIADVLKDWSIER
jgi:perosamine synthetase